MIEVKGKAYVFMSGKQLARYIATQIAPKIADMVSLTISRPVTLAIMDDDDRDFPKRVISRSQIDYVTEETDDEIMVESAVTITIYDHTEDFIRGYLDGVRDDLEELGFDDDEIEDELVDTDTDQMEFYNIIIKIPKFKQYIGIQVSRMMEHNKLHFEIKIKTHTEDENASTALMNIILKIAQSTVDELSDKVYAGVSEGSKDSCTYEYQSPNEEENEDE